MLEAFHKLFYLIVFNLFRELLQCEIIIISSSLDLFFVNEHDVGGSNKKIKHPTSCSYIKKKGSEDEVLLWKSLDLNNYYYTLQ